MFQMEIFEWKNAWLGCKHVVHNENVHPKALDAYYNNPEGDVPLFYLLPLSILQFVDGKMCSF